MTYEEIIKIKVEMESIKAYKPKTSTARQAIRIGSMSFAEYVAKRLTKDGLGFVPVSHVCSSATDCKTYITAPIPQNDLDFLGFVHELGHCKSKQPRQDEQIGMYSSWCNGRIECEYNAWIWGLRYFRRLGFKMTQELSDKVVQYFGSYLNSARDNVFAKDISRKFHKATGIDIHVKSKEDEYENIKQRCNEILVGGKVFPAVFGWNYGNKNSRDFFGYDEASPIDRFNKTQVVKSNWKPWHDLKKEQIKKQWRNVK